MKKIFIVLLGLGLFIFGLMICIGTVLDLSAANPDSSLSANIFGVIALGAIPTLLGGYICYRGLTVKS